MPNWRGFWGCQNTAPQAGWCKVTETYSQGSGSQRSKIKVLAGLVP